MSTEKRKFELYQRLQAIGFTYDEARALRRIEMTLQRWAEQECGDGNEYGSWAIERDEASGIPYMVRHHYRHGHGKDTVTRYKIADREKGALKRCERILNARNAREAAYGSVGTVIDEITYYHQGDPRGCALYLLRTSDHKPGERLDSIYTRGLAVCA